jgi:hypothetical protein
MVVGCHLRFPGSLFSATSWCSGCAGKSFAWGGIGDVVLIVVGVVLIVVGRGLVLKCFQVSVAFSLFSRPSSIGLLSQPAHIQDKLDLTRFRLWQVNTHTVCLCGFLNRLTVLGCVFRVYGRWCRIDSCKNDHVGWGQILKVTQCVCL